MSDPLTIGASVVGVVVPALHGTRLLIDDVQKIVDAPTTVEHLANGLASLDSTLRSLQAIEEADWEALGHTIAEQSKSVVITCTTACETFHADLQRWTRRSQGGKLSWRDRAKIGFFKERQIRSISEHLQSCKLVCVNVVGMATLYSSIRNTHITGDIREAVTARETDIAAAANMTNARLADVESCLAEMKIDETETRDENGTDDLESALAQLKDELTALKSSQSLLPELLSRAKSDGAQLEAAGQKAITNVTFGDRNSGFQVGVSNGNISNITLGQSK